MNRFKNILYVSFSSGAETPSLKRAIELAAANSAALQVLVVYPQLGKAHDSFKSNYESVLLEKMEDSVQSLLAELHQPHLHTVKINIEGAKAFANTVIQRVLRDDHDLIIKEAESKRKGFKAIDMDLLRQCPCPVWLNRDSDGAQSSKSVAVAIDPEVTSEQERALSTRLLQLAASLAQSRGVQLTVVSCWDYVYEDFLRHNAWTSIPEHELHKLIETAQTQHRQALEALLKQADIPSDTNIMHLRGQPDEVIARTVEEQKIDVLVMGTLARTGIPGFIIGNTAENVAQTLRCSLLAMKPAGFTSPVKAYD